MSAEDFKYYETTFLQMQKDIFYDASMMHEAYLEGGLGSIDELRAAGLLGDPAQSQEAMKAWTDIDTGRRTGDDSLLDAGNKGLLYREQRHTIDDQYSSMRDHPVTGEAMTYLMGVIGKPSIPDTQTLGEVDGVDIPVDLMPLIPGVQGGDIETNIPKGNIADFDTRWGLIEKDTMPKYLKLYEDDPDELKRILNQDVRERIDENRLIWRVDDILKSLTSAGVDWRIK